MVRCGEDRFIPPALGSGSMSDFRDSAGKSTAAAYRRGSGVSLTRDHATCATRSRAMRRLSSGRHEPQLVPAWHAAPTAATSVAPLATAARTTSCVTLWHAHTTGEALLGRSSNAAIGKVGTPPPPRGGPAA